MTASTPRSPPASSCTTGMPPPEQTTITSSRANARMRLALFTSKKHRRSRSFGWWALLAWSPDEFGLISLYGITVTPGAGSPGGKAECRR